jgi:hypothetical protein
MGYMSDITKLFMPVTLINKMTSFNLYGVQEYTLTSTEGGPVQDELGGVISFAEANLTNALSFEAVLVDVTPSTEPSAWLKGDTDDEDAFPRGTKIAVVKFTITNNSDKDVDVYGLYVKAWFDHSERLASPVLPIAESPHVKAGYPAYLVDLFEMNEDQWILAAGHSMTFADSFYIEREGELLNVNVIAPDCSKQGNDEDKFTSSSTFQLAT